jgi:hypothetical protein
VLTVDQEVGGSNPPSCTSLVFTEESASDLTRIKVLIFASGKHREALSACFVTLALLRPFSNPTMRALREHVVGLAGQLVWEPACGTGIMSTALGVRTRRRLVGRARLRMGSHPAGFPYALPAGRDWDGRVDHNQSALPSSGRIRRASFRCRQPRCSDPGEIGMDRGMRPLRSIVLEEALDRHRAIR